MYQQESAACLLEYRQFSLKLKGNFHLLCVDCTNAYRTISASAIKSALSDVPPCAIIAFRQLSARNRLRNVM
jgi:hypothetical protein